MGTGDFLIPKLSVGSNGFPVHGAWNPTGHPDIGTSTFYFELNGPPNSVAFLHVGFSNTVAGPFTLPFSLTPFGAPGCEHLTDSIFSFPLTTNSIGVALISLFHPDNPALIGFEAYSQFINADPTGNAFGFTYTNGVKTTLGNSLSQ